MEYYATSLQHILAELERVDLLIRIQVWRARQIQQLDDEFQGFYISEREVDALMAEPAGLPRWATEPGPISMAEVQTTLERMTTGIAERKAESARLGISLRLEELVRLFRLAPFEIDVLLICLAPELDLRYERLYAYLQDDVTKKRPSVDLVLNLLCPFLRQAQDTAFEAKLEARRHFTPSAPLLAHRLVSLFDDPSHHHPPLLSKYLKADERVVSYLLGSDELDACLLPYIRHSVPRVRLEDLLLPTDVKRRLALLVREKGAAIPNEAERRNGLIFYFQGPYGVGKRTTAEALCRELGLGLMAVDGERLLNASDPTFDTAVCLVMREALLQGAALYWSDFDALLADGKQAWRETLLRALEERQGLTFLAGDVTWEPVDALHALPFVRIEFSRPAYAERMRLWALSLDSHTPLADDVSVGALANKFRFSGGQIRDAAATARNLARWRDPEHEQVSMADLYAACRLQSNRKLATLAHKIVPHYTWPDIVLPPDRLEQLREICNCVKYRAQVYDEWGFDRKLSLGKGLNVLFTGPSGTGKTMAAEVIANELSLDLYKIDLSQVVSKYIGETEKNLDRVFREAQTSNAILFFDEADALFGKRSEVKDAHDRYANIETGYLLQKMEEYEGVAILATNLQANLDEAFARRMHFTVEFPFPDEAHRYRIWQGIFPAEAPLAEDVDMATLARSFKLSGGNIRNIALAAAFLSAAEEQTIGMGHLLRAAKREFQKVGRPWEEARTR
jgi:SpoVK/Ycf46/Vps4 family AAA+-type ATPase